MTQEEIDRLQELLKQRKELIAFLNVEANVCRVDYRYNDDIDYCSVSHKDFNEEVNELAQHYINKINKEIERI